MGHTRGRVTFFFAGNWGRAEKTSPGKKHGTTPPPLINDRFLICIHEKKCVEFSTGEVWVVVFF